MPSGDQKNCIHACKWRLHGTDNDIYCWQVQSVQDADAKIDQLAKNGKLNPALMLTMANAYAAAKDTDYTKEQVKDVMAHLYFKVALAFPLSLLGKI